MYTIFMYMDIHSSYGAVYSLERSSFVVEKNNPITPDMDMIKELMKEN